MEDKLDDVTKK
jgi:hypothetical protein